MNWTLSQLKFFVTAVEQGSFSAAARKLGRVQSRVSTAIAELEDDLGVRLFNRDEHRPVLTKPGEEIYSEARQILAHCELMQTKAVAISGGQESSLTVAMDEALPVMAIEQVLVQLSHHFPLFKLTVKTGSETDISLWVDQGDADIGLCKGLHSFPESVCRTTIGRYYHSLIVSEDHPLQESTSPSLEQLRQHRQLVIRGRMEQTGVRSLSPDYWLVDNFYCIISLVSQGVGWAIVPEHIARNRKGKNKIVSLSLDGLADIPPVEIALIKRSDSQDGPVKDWLYARFKELFSD